MTKIISIVKLTFFVHCAMMVNKKISFAYQLCLMWRYLLILSRFSSDGDDEWTKMSGRMLQWGSSLHISLSILLLIIKVKTNTYNSIIWLGNGNISFRLTNDKRCRKRGKTRAPHVRAIINSAILTAVIKRFLIFHFCYRWIPLSFAVVHRHPSRARIEF